MPDASRDNDADAGLLSPLFATGRPFLTLGTLGLLFAGGFAIFLAAAGQFLPHDIQFLGITASELCGLDGCRIVHFMINDRVSFGGVLVALSVLYLWLIHFPLRAGERWAWWTLLASSAAGFTSFLGYLGFGYLDTWHGLGTLMLLPCFAVGLAVTHRTRNPSGRSAPCGWRTPTIWPASRPAAALGRWLLLATATGLFAAGLTIMLVGMTVVFVPQDLQYMGTTAAGLNALSPRLLPLIVHDRAGFGAGVPNVGFLVFACAWCGRFSRHLWQALALAGAIGFGTAIGVHPLVGYNNPVHLAPACAGAVAYAAALVLTRPGRSLGAGTAESNALALVV